MRRAKSVWDELKTGKLDEREHDETGMFGGRHHGLRRTMRLAMRSRANWILRGLGRNTHKAPVIIKQVSLARRQEALRRVARYIARIGFEYPTPADRPIEASASKRRPPARVTERAARKENHEPVVYDQDGNRIARHQVLDVLKTWGLLEDRENLTPKGVSVLRTGGQRALDVVPEADAFEEVQGRHIVISVPMLDLQKKAEFEEIVRQFVKETFGAWDYPAIAAVHVEHGKEVHGHILVGTSNLRTLDIESIDGRRTWNAAHERFFFDRDGIVADALRLVLAEVAQRFGMEVDASRREDRMELVFEILQGNEEIRPRPPQKQRGREPEIDGLRDLPAILQRLVRRAPVLAETFATEFVENYIEDQSRRAERRRPPAPIETPPERKAGWFERLFGNKKPSPKAEPEPKDDAQRTFGRILKPVVDRVRQLKIFIDTPERDRTREAIDLWGALYLENRSFARWVLLNTPSILGPVTSEAPKLRKDAAFVDLIEDLDFSEIEQSMPLRPKRRPTHELLEQATKTTKVIRQALQAREEAPWDQKFAHDGYRQIIRSYRQLAETIEAAFTGDEPEVQDAARLRDLAGLIESIDRLPIGSREIAEIRELLGVPTAFTSEKPLSENTTPLPPTSPADDRPNRKQGPSHER